MTLFPKKSFYNTAFNLTVLVTGLGFFIDTFDFFLYNSMRVPSLTELGLSGTQLTRAGIFILNSQIGGSIIGSLALGVLGDKIGRKKTLLGSILIYSLGMIGTAFVHDPVTYMIMRFITGFGAAGEIGLGATLVGETIQSSKRTFALAFFSILGALGVAVAALSLEFVSWRTSCLGGGIFGLLLLLLRSVLFESKLFMQAAESKIQRGSLRDLFGTWENLKKFVGCTFVLVPNYFITGVLLTLAPEVARGAGVQGVIKGNIALAAYFTVAMFGDLIGAWLSERFKSRRKIAGAYIIGNAVLALVILQKLDLGVFQFYAICAAMGLFNLWALSCTVSIEQFPTNLRATASTGSLNFARGGTIIMNLVFLALISFGLNKVLFGLGVVVAAMGLMAIGSLRETYGRSLAGEI